MAAAEKRMAAAVQKLAVQVAHAEGRLATAVDHVLASGSLDVRGILGRRPGGGLHERG
jgi:hypothetical protein